MTVHEWLMRPLGDYLPMTLDVCVTLRKKDLLGAHVFDASDGWREFIISHVTIENGVAVLHAYLSSHRALAHHCHFEKPEPKTWSINGLCEEHVAMMASKGIEDFEVKEQLLKVSEELFELHEAYVLGSRALEREEMADVVLASLMLANKLGIDLDAAIAEKMKKNKERPFKRGTSKEGQ